MTTVRVEGLAELEAALAELPKATGKNVLKRVLMAAAAPIEADAAAAAPHLTGRLRRDVATGTRLTRRQAGLARKLGKSEVEVHVGVKDPAGVQNEFGNIHQPPQPFLRPAWDANKDSALETIASQLGEEIEKSAARLARRAARRAKVQGV
jgi:HK97 gp10 family phage protein